MMVECRPAARAFAVLLGAKSLHKVAFREQSRSFLCSVPGDDLWGAVKDVLLMED